MARIDSRNPKFSYLCVHGPPAHSALARAGPAPGGTRPRVSRLVSNRTQ